MKEINENELKNVTGGGVRPLICNHDEEMKCLSKQGYHWDDGPCVCVSNMEPL